MRDVTLAGRRFAVTRFTNIIDDCWTGAVPQRSGEPRGTTGSDRGCGQGPNIASPQVSAVSAAGKPKFPKLRAPAARPGSPGS